MTASTAFCSLLALVLDLLVAHPAERRLHRVAASEPNVEWRDMDDEFDVMVVAGGPLGCGPVNVLYDIETIESNQKAFANGK